MATALLVGLDQLLRAISPDCQTFRPNWTVAATREDPHDFQSRRADDANSIRLGVLTVRKGLRDNLIYRPQSTDALITAGQHALFWTDKIDTTAAKNRDIVLGGGMKPHFTIHGRRYQNRRSGRECDRGERVVRQPERKLSDNVRRCRCDQQQVRSIRQVDMTGMPVRRFSKEIGGYWIARKCLQCERRNELGGSLSQNDMNAARFLSQFAGDIS